MNDPFTFDRFLALPRLSALKLSPDGTRLVVAVSRLGPEGKEMKTALWQVDPAGAAKPRRITRSAAGESVGCFARDGSLLFTSARPDPDAKADPDKKINGIYTDQDSSKTYQDIASGALDFTFSEKLMLSVIKDTYKIDLDYVELPKEQSQKIQDPAAYFIFSKIGDGPKIQAAFDGAIRTLKANGKLKALSVQFLGGDYTK